MSVSSTMRILALAMTMTLVWAMQPERVESQQSELRKGASGSGEILTNDSKTIARRRTRPAKPRPSAVGTRLKTASDYFNQGDEYFEKGQYAEAANAFKQAIQLDPKYQEAYYALGDAYLKLKDDDKALETDRQGLEIAQSNKTLVHAGEMNSKALNFQTPTKPPIARAARVSGSVKVEIIVDENGYVMSARVVEGHALLRQAAVKAAMEVKFEPFTLGGKPAKVSGVLVYEFSYDN